MSVKYVLVRSSFEVRKSLHFAKSNYSNRVAHCFQINTINVRCFSNEKSLPSKESNSSKLQDEAKIKKLAIDFFAFMEKLLHMDEVIKAQAHVMKIKDDLKRSGDRKREILFELNFIRDELKKCHDNICNSSRGTQRYIALISEEAKILENEKAKQLEFTKADELEGKYFNHLTNAINNSYEKEKLYSNTLRNLGIIGTILGSVISFIGATLGFYLHHRKSGLIIQNLNETLKETIKREIGLLKEELNIDELRRTVFLLEKEQKEITRLIKKYTNENQEGWGGYIKRHATRAFRWVYPAN